MGPKQTDVGLVQSLTLKIPRSKSRIDVGLGLTLSLNMPGTKQVCGNGPNPNPEEAWDNTKKCGLGLSLIFNSPRPKEEM